MKEHLREFKAEAEAKMKKHGGSRGQVWTGIFILLIGIAALLKASIPEFPDWIFTWPMLLIAIGFYNGIKSGFKGPTWFILMLVGGAFLTAHIMPDLEMRRYIWPMVFICIGLFFIFNSNKRNWKNCGEKKSENNPGIEDATVVDESINNSEDVVDATSVFGSIKKNIFSKNFKGGEVVSIMGGTEINLSQADIQGTAVLETFQLFGGTKIIVPASWEVKTEMVAIFGGVEDKRFMNKETINPDKILVLRGTTIFGGLEIKSF